MQQTTFGVIVGNRGFFPDHLAETGRTEILAALEKAGIGAVCLTPADTKAGSIVTWDDVAKCAQLFKANRDKIDGILITLPNFGEERAIVGALREANLNVPVLVHAFDDEVAKMTIADRRDSFCGKMSTCNNLRQYGIPFSLTSKHTMNPNTPEFQAELQWFAGVCRVVKGLKGARIGALGARPAAFNTVRYSEKLLERSGISVDTLDLSEVMGRANALPSSDSAVQAKLAAIKDYVGTKGISEDALLKMAKFGVVVDRWMSENGLVANAIQCWTSMEEFFGVVPCTTMSMFSNSLIPSACEVDIPGVVGMYALQLATGRPSALVDWNNNYGEDPDKAVVFHCSNLPKDVFQEATMDYQAIIAGSVGKENTYGTVVGRVRPGTFTYCRVSTDDFAGRIVSYMGEGQFTNDPLLTFGGYGVVQIPNLQGLLRYICENGFEHHVAISMASASRILEEAFGKYMGWGVYNHK